MDTFERACTQFLTFAAQVKGSSVDDLRSYWKDMIDSMRFYLSQPRLPLPGQSVAVSHGQTKTAALFFDRVWNLPGASDNPLDETIVFGATEVELWPVFFIAARSEGFLTEAEISSISQLGSNLGFYKEFGFHPHAAVANSLAQAHGIKAIPVYRSTEHRDAEYVTGSARSLLSVIEGVGVVDEKQLSWEQVGELRTDATSRASLRRLRHWLDKDLAGKPLSFVIDSVAIRVEEYETALKKHGILTITGVMSDLLDEKFLFGVAGIVSATSLAGGSFPAALAGAGLAVGRATVSVTNKLIDLGGRTSVQGSEVAFVHELKKLT